MAKQRNLKYLHMTWDESAGLLRIVTLNQETGNISGEVELNFTYMFSVTRFMLSIFQSYVSRGRLARVKAQKAENKN